MCIGWLTPPMEKPCRPGCALVFGVLGWGCERCCSSEGPCSLLIWSPVPFLPDQHSGVEKMTIAYRICLLCACTVNPAIKSHLVWFFYYCIDSHWLGSSYEDLVAPSRNLRWSAFGFGLQAPRKMLQDTVKRKHRDPPYNQELNKEEIQFSLSYTGFILNKNWLQSHRIIRNPTL